MENENNNISSNLDGFRAQRDIISINECAEEINLRQQQFLRAYNNPAIDVHHVVERARILHDIIDGFLELLKILIREHSDKKNESK